MKNQERRLSLAQPATYQIKVPGVLDEGWLAFTEDITITVDSDGESQPTSTISSNVDQAALHGLLRHLYYHGLPLISVIWIESG